MRISLNHCIELVAAVTALVVIFGLCRLFLDNRDEQQGHSHNEVLIALNSLSASEYEDYMAKSKAYDYCGLDSKGEGFHVRGIGCREKGGRVVDALYFKKFVRFQSELERMERVSISNDRLSFSNAVDQVRKLLVAQRDECIDSKVRFPSGLFIHCLEKTEYALLRCLEQKGECVRPDAHDIVSALPDVFFLNSLDKCRWITGTSSSLSTLRVFRDMMVVASFIIKYDLENGHLPQSLDEIVDKTHEENVERFLYSCRGKSWQLFFPKSSMAERLPFNVYVPSVFRDTSWPISKGLWISSDFSEKRRALYIKGHLNEAYPEWACRFTEGSIRRPEFHRETRTGRQEPCIRDVDACRDSL